MEFDQQTATVTADGASYPVTHVRASAAKGSLPGVIVVQEIFGVTDHTVDVGRRLAAAGFHSFVPDLYAIDGRRDERLSCERLTEFRQFIDSLPRGAFWDAKKRPEILAQRPADQRARFVDTLAAMYPVPIERMTSTLVATARWARENVCAGRKVGALGFCTGGELVGQLACADRELGAAVIYYGTPPVAAKVPAIQCAVLGLFGGRELDSRITGDVPAFEQAMREHGKRFDYVIYDDARHAFFNDTRPFWHADAVRDSWGRALAFLARELA